MTSVSSVFETDCLDFASSIHFPIVSRSQLFVLSVSLSSPCIPQPSCGVARQLVLPKQLVLLLSNPSDFYPAF